MADKWYYWANEERRGPISGRILRDLAEIGKIQPSDYILRESSEKRLQAGEVPGLYRISEWHFTRDDTQHGPVTSQTLMHLAEYLELSPTDLVWKEGMSDWVPASKVNGLFVAKSHDAGYTPLYLCESCGDLGIGIEKCPSCPPDESRQTRLTPGTGIGLIGLPCTGKTCYLAAVHDQLMHSAPDWRVRVNDRAFERLTADFGRMYGGIPDKTAKVCSQSVGFFNITVIRGNQTLPFVLNDMAGEYAFSMRMPSECDLDELWEAPWPDRDVTYFSFLRQCRGLLVAIPCWQLRSALEGVLHPTLNRSDNDRDAVRKADTVLARLFRKLTRLDHFVKHVEVVLVGVDIYGDDPTEACTKATDSFNRLFRTFPGVLRNAGITVGSTPVSNIGFGNDVGLDEQWGVMKVMLPPNPFNVLTPIQRILEPVSTESTQTNAATSAVSVSKRSRDSNRPKAFLSYRRENGAETARLLRSSLEAAGWNAFLDVDDLGSSFFDDRLLLEIQQADAFILVLSPGSLDRCSATDDWLRREIGHAMKCRKRIVPVSQNGFQFSKDLQLPQEIAALARINCVEYSHQYYQATFDRLMQYLSEE